MTARKSRLKGGRRQDCLPRNEDGFAMLMVFLMASMIAISLYMEMPRVAFQAERQKEQLLVERGQQYKRAIGLFLRTNKRWPARIEELESFNNRRFLRKRYIDPMTGKDEWRLIHIVNGVLIDSVTNKPSNSQTQGASQPSGFIAEIQGFGQQSSGTQGVNPGLRRRPSDGGPSVGPDGQPIQSASGGTSSTGSYPGAPPVPGSVLPGVSGGYSGVPSGVPPGAQGGQGIAGVMGIPANGQTGASGQTNNQSSGGLMGGLVGGLMGGGLTGGGYSPQPTVPGAPPQGFPGNGAPATNGVPGNGQPGGIQINPSAQAAAAGLLQNLLTQPRPGGLQGITSVAGSGTVMGGGIAGVASKGEGESIMVYGTRTDFSEWEFIYDPMKFQVKNPNSTGGGAIGVPAAQLGSTAGMSQAGTPIGTGPGGSQPSMGPGGIAAGSGAGTSAAGFSMGGGSAGTLGANGATGTTGSSGATPAGSAAFGQPGLSTDVRPGKK